MAIYDYNDKVTFDLPDDYELQSEINDDGDEIFTVRGEFYLDDDFERQSKYSCRISEGTVEWDEESKGKTMRQLWTDGFAAKENIRYVVLQDSPAVLFSTMGQSMLMFGREFRMMATTVFVEVAHDQFLILIGITPYNEDEPDHAVAALEKMRKVLGALRINGKIAVESIPDAEKLFSAVKPCYDGSEPIDTGIKLNITINAGDTSTTYEYGSSGDEPKVTTFQLNHVTPEERLYPHYHSLKFGPTAMLSMLGAQINTTGTEYSFMPLSREMEDPEDGLSESGIAVLQRIVAADAGKYNLHKSAAQMAPLFRVDSSVFDAKHDRESELMDGLMHRSYMMSALRSFAWSLSDWCVQKSVKPADLTYDELCRIIAFVSGENWLNYDETYCNGLCGCPDLHVYYLPDSVSHSDRQALLPSAEKLAEIEAIKEKFPNFNQILSTVHSLDSLRRDLEYVFPAIETIYAQLEAERDRMQPLIGDVADILYAWCALALAAKQPFFTEDGPVNCWFDQKDEPIVPYVITKGNKITLEQKTDDHVAKTGTKKTVPTTLDLPNGIYIVDGNYAVIDDDWAIRLPDGWVYSTDPEITGDRSFVANSGEDYENNDGIAIYSDNCFTVFQKSDNGLVSMMAGSLLNQNADALISRSDLQVTYNCHHADDTTYCQYVIVTTKWATYMIQFFYTDPNLNEYGRIGEIEKILRTICLADEVPAIDYTEAQKNHAFAEKEEPKTGSTTQVTLIAPAGCKLEGTELTEYDGSVSCVVIPEGVTKIDYFAFREDSALSLRELELPRSVTLDETICFGECKSLEAVKIGEGATCMLSGWFSGCSALKTVQLPSTLQRIEDFTFKDCSSLHEITIPEAVTEIGEYAFADCGIKNLKLPSNLKRIEKAAFQNCTEIEELLIPDGVEEIAKSAFYGCSNLKQVQIPASVKKIGDSAFANCSALVSVMLPRGMEVIESYAFRSCSNLKTLYIPATVKELGDNILLCCENFKCVYGEAGSYAEKHCKEHYIACEPYYDGLPDEFIVTDGVLTQYNGEGGDIVIPANVKTIGTNVFAYKDEITSVAIMGPVEAIEEDAFTNCENLKEISFSAGLKKIGESAFWGCKRLNHITLPEGIEEIEDYAFHECESLEKISIPSGLKKLGMRVFGGCISLKHVIISDKIEALFEDDVFNECQIEKLVIADESNQLKWPMIGILGMDSCEPDASVVTKAGSWIFEGNPNFAALQIPDSVTAIGEETFIGVEGVHKIFIPDGVTTIGYRAFAECPGIQHIEIADSVTTIEDDAFEFCDNLTSVVLPKNLQAIGNGWFGWCEKLSNIVIPDGVVTIGQGAFKKCESLGELYIPASVREIGDEAFPENCVLCVIEGSYAEAFCKENELSYKCVAKKEFPETQSVPGAWTKLAAEATIAAKITGVFDGVKIVDGVVKGYLGSNTTVKIPDGVHIIDERAFLNKPEIVSIDIPESVTRIANAAFAVCDGLTAIVIPEGVVEIGDGAFYGCHNLKDIYLPVSLQSVGQKAFEEVAESVTVYAYSGSFAESYAKDNNLAVNIRLTPEQEAEQKRQQEEAERQRREEELRRQREYEERCRREAEEREHRALEEAKRRREAEEEAARKHKAELEEKRNRFDQISNAISLQMQIIAQNKGWFGAQAKARKAAQEQLAILQAQLTREFPNGKP